MGLLVAVTIPLILIKVIRRADLPKCWNRPELLIKGHSSGASEATWALTDRVYMIDI